MNRADWPLLQDGAVSLFWRPEVLDDTRRALDALGYEVSDISGVSGWPHFIEKLSSVLRWQEQFGYAPWTGNLNALNDAMGGYPFGAANQSALIIRDFDILVGEDAEGSQGLLDVLESAARDHLLWGRTLVILIHTNDNRYYSGPIGDRPARWHPREWLNRDRDL